MDYDLDVAEVGLGLLSVAIDKHLYLFERYQPFTDDLVQLGDEGVDALRLIDDLDDHGQVFREAQDARTMDAAVGAKAKIAAQHGSAGQFALARPFNDDLIERPSLELVALTDEDAQQPCFTQ